MLCLSGPVAIAAEPQSISAATTEEVALLAASCTGCHGANKGNALPALYGRRAGRLEKYLQGYKTGKRTGTLMPRLVRGYSDEQLAALARYFSTTRVPRR